jgi:thermitase
VSATDRKDKLATFSGRGKWVDLAAPGTNILSTQAGVGYGEESGTSLSAPFVSALAGLLASQDMSADRIRNRMETTATDLGPTGKDPRFGHGRIDAASAVR